MTRRILPLLLFGLLAGPAAAAPTRLAGVDIGAKGVRGVVVEYDSAAPTTRDKVVFMKSTNPAAGLLKDGKLVPAQVADAADDVGEFVRIFTAEQNVAPGNIRLVGSSSLAALADRDTLSAAVEAKTKLKMTFLSTPDEEVRLTIDGLAVLGNRPRGLLIDVGGGNGKGGAPGAAGLDTFGVPFGSVSLRVKALDLVKEKKVTYPEALAAVRDTDVIPAVRKAVAGKPSLSSQQHVTLTGGVAYIAATILRPAEANAPTVTLTLADFRGLIDTLEKNGLRFPEVDLSAVTDPAVRKRAEENIANARGIYNAEQIVAGCTVVLAIGDGLKLDGRPLTFIPDAQYAWIVGALAPLPYEPKPIPLPADEGEEPKSKPRPAVITARLSPPPEPLAMGAPYGYAAAGYGPLYSRPYGFPNYYPPSLGGGFGPLAPAAPRPFAWPR